MAVGWTFICREPWLLGLNRFLRRSFFSARPIDQPASHKGLGSKCVADVGSAFHAPRIATPHFHHDLDAELIAWNHWATKPGAFNSGKQYQLGVAILDFGEQQHSARLSHGLDDEDTRHYGKAGKVSSEELLVDRNVLDGHNSLPAIKIDHAVNEQEWKTMWKDSLDLSDVQRDLGRGGLGRGLSSFGHSVSR